MNWHLGKKVGCCAALAAALCVGGISHAQVNGIINPDFEVDADSSGNPDLWFRGGAVAYVMNDDSDGIGTHSVSAQNGGDWRSRAFPVTPGQKVTFSLDYKVSPG